jgi:hypothetical protein
MPQPTLSQISDFFTRLGLTIAPWQIVESSLFNIYARVIGARNYDGPSASFHTPTNFRTRLQMTDEAVKRSNMEAALIDEWNKIYISATKRSKRRNAIAHSVVIFKPTEKDSGRQLFLSPNISDIGRFSGSFKPGEIILQSELEEMMKSFDSPNERMAMFLLKLIRSPTTPPLTSS